MDFLLMRLYGIITAAPQSMKARIYKRISPEKGSVENGNNFSAA
jgi:hypothetical protein